MKIELEINELSNLISKDFNENTRLSFYACEGNIYIRFSKVDEVLYSGAETIAISFKDGKIKEVEKGLYDGEFNKLFTDFKSQ